MHCFRHKAVAVAAAAVGISGLAISGSAHAAPGQFASVQLTVCNNSSVAQSAQVRGPNQNGVESTSYVFSVGANGCYKISNWWWETGETIIVDHHAGGQPWAVSVFMISEEVPNNVGQTATITQYGP